MESKEVRDYIVDALRNLGNAAAVKLIGNFFSGADVVIENKDGNPEMYRVTVTKYNQQKQFN